MSTPSHQPPRMIPRSEFLAKYKAQYDSLLDKYEQTWTKDEELFYQRYRDMETGERQDREERQRKIREEMQPLGLKDVTASLAKETRRHPTSTTSLSTGAPGFSARDPLSTSSNTHEISAEEVLKIPDHKRTKKQKEVAKRYHQQVQEEEKQKRIEAVKKAHQGRSQENPAPPTTETRTSKQDLWEIPLEDPLPAKKKPQPRAPSLELGTPQTPLKSQPPRAAKSTPKKRKATTPLSRETSSELSVPPSDTSSDSEEDTGKPKEFPGVKNRIYQAIRRKVEREVQADSDRKLARRFEELSQEFKKATQRATDPGLLTGSDIRATRDRIYFRDDYVNVIQPGNKSSKTGKPRVKPAALEDNRTSQIFRDEYNTPLNSGQAFRFAKLKYRLFFDPKAHLPSVTYSYPPPEEPKKPKADPHVTTRPVGIVSDTLSAKESAGGALTIRAGRVAKIQYQDNKTGYRLLDSDNAYLGEEWVHFSSPYALSNGKANEEALRSAALELKAERDREAIKRLEEWKKDWATWKDVQRKWEYRFLLHVASMEAQSRGDPRNPVYVRWPNGTTCHDVLGKPMEELLEAKYDHGYVREEDAGNLLYQHVDLNLENAITRTGEIRKEYQAQIPHGVTLDEHLRITEQVGLDAVTKQRKPKKKDRDVSGHELITEVKGPKSTYTPLKKLREGKAIELAEQEELAEKRKADEAFAAGAELEARFEEEIARGFDEFAVEDPTIPDTPKGSPSVTPTPSSKSNRKPAGVRLQQVTRKKIKVEHYPSYDPEDAITIARGPGSQEEPFDLDAEAGSSTAYATTSPLPVPTDDAGKTQIVDRYLETREFPEDLCVLLYDGGLEVGDIFAELIQSPRHDFISPEGFERLKELSKIRMAAREIKEAPVEDPDTETESEED